MDDSKGKFKNFKKRGWKNNLYSILKTLARLLSRSNTALVKARKGRHMMLGAWIKVCQCKKKMYIWYNVQLV